MTFTEGLKTVPQDMVIRSFQPGDEELLPELWNLCLVSDPVSPERFCERVLLDPNFEPEGLLVAEQGTRLIGFVLAVVRRVPWPGGRDDADRGWITAIGVHPGWRRQGVGSALLQRAFVFFRSRERRPILVSQYSPNYFLPGVDEEAYPHALIFFKHHGFQESARVVAMERNLLTWTGLPDSVLDLKHRLGAEGIQVSHLSRRLLVPLLQFAENKFGPDWARAVRDGLLRGGPPERVLVAHAGDQVIGYCMYGLYDRPVERFGPFGVDPAWRGKGIGKLLLYLCLQEMRRQGLQNAWFLSTVEESPAGNLYRQAGFHTTRRFRMLRADLT